MPVIILLIATSSFPRRVSKKHITINCLILTALLPAQSGECKTVLWPFFKERLQGKGGRLINGWNQLNKWLCPVLISLLSFRKAWSSPTAPLAQSALFRLLPGRLGIWASHGFVPLSFGKAISKLVCLLLTPAMPKQCGAWGFTPSLARALNLWCEQRVGTAGSSWGHLGAGPNLQHCVIIDSRSAEAELRAFR